MKRLLSIRTLALMMALSAAVAAHSYTLTNETLHYDIVYHWGLIWKHAGSATLSIKKSGYNYDASLSARTISWADKVFRVRDTLSCTIQPSGMRPIVYRKASHEGKHSGIDIVRYSYNGNTSLAECTRIRPGKANNVVRLQANGQAYDMLSIFFYIRALDYKAMVKTTFTQRLCSLEKEGNSAHTACRHGNHRTARQVETRGLPRIVFFHNRRQEEIIRRYAHLDFNRLFA